MDEDKIKMKDINGDILGANISGQSNTVKKEEYHGTVIHHTYNIYGSDAALKHVNAFRTDVNPDEAAGLNSNNTPDEKQKIEINNLYERIVKLEQSGTKIESIQSGTEKITRIELTIKKAVLLSTEAEQLWIDHVSKRTAESGGNVSDQNELRKGFDNLTYNRRLLDAYSLLEQANQEDPTNTEVLLNMAKLLMVLTPDDPTDEEKLLYRIQNLLTEPKNDNEKFRLAQANFLLATTRKPYNISWLQSSKKMFQDLGRAEWVSHIDTLMQQDNSQPQQQTQSNMPQQQFSPAGKWFVKINDFAGSTMNIELQMNGSFSGVQQSYGFNLTATGNWSFDPYSNTLFIQGWVNGFQPFMMQVFIQNIFQNGFNGIDGSGIGYQFTKSQ
ncbi:MAG: tetratricopeptide repeat protein [Ignavibacteriales bacterium]|nr:MAG: tetratricopeptide repeat protein [Ignavibacteriales bacterium]